MRHGSEADTIFALSSGHLPAAIAVVRVSGPRAGEALRTLIGKIPPPRQATLARVREPGGEILDEALALWFPGPNSETGEDTAELQLHGGRAVVASVLAQLGRIAGCRPAEAGEFTRRAFENGRLDLTRVEGLADLIAADTEAQRRQAFRHMKGLLGDRAEAWRTQLIEALALIEARIDFPDEGDVPQDLATPALARARALRDEIAKVLDDQHRGERLRDGLVVAIAGPPNVGKSSLLNRLARRDAAIVSPYAGTTRDVIEVHMDCGGYPITLLDTAGIRAEGDVIEREGVRRARERAAVADLVLWVLDASTDDQAAVATASQEFPNSPKWIVWNKVDLIDQNRTDELRSIGYNIGYRVSFTSTLSESGISTFWLGLVAHAGEHAGTSEPALVTRLRHRRSLEDTVAALDRALAESAPVRDEIVAEELRLAARSLGRLTGRVDVEDILDTIFRDFCIGK